MIGAVLIGKLLDDTSRSRRSRAISAVAAVGLLVGVSWGFGIYVNASLELDSPVIVTSAGV